MQVLEVDDPNRTGSLRKLGAFDTDVRNLKPVRLDKTTVGHAQKPQAGERENGTTKSDLGRCGRRCPSGELPPSPPDGEYPRRDVYGCNYEDKGADANFFRAQQER